MGQQKRHQGVGKPWEIAIDFSKFTGSWTAENLEVARHQEPDRHVRPLEQILREPSHHQKQVECAGGHLERRDRGGGDLGREVKMSNWLKKWRGQDQAMSPERRAMTRRSRAWKSPIAHANPDAKPEGRLAFILDLTGSRRASLCNARIAIASMFETVKAIGAIAVKLIYYRGKNECRAGSWRAIPRL